MAGQEESVTSILSSEREKVLARRKRKKEYRKKRRQNEVEDTLRKLGIDLNQIPDFFYPIPPLERFETSSQLAQETKEKCLKNGNLNNIYSTWVPKPVLHSTSDRALDQRLSDSIPNNIYSITGSSIVQNKGFRSHTETIKSSTRGLTQSFWDQIPVICSPNAFLVANDRIIEVNKRNEEKYQNKLRAKLKSGDITQREMEQKLSKNGRTIEASNDIKLNESDIGEATQIQIKTNNEVIDSSISLMPEDRRYKKCLQIENFASIFEIFGQKKCVIDFGSGSGNLCLAFAAIFPETKFVFCDMKEESLNILRNRANDAGLSNVFIFQRQFSPQNASEDVKLLKKEYPEFDLGIGLHCCGNFTDLIMDICARCNADCVVCPCCNGKIARFIERGNEYVEKSENKNDSRLRKSNTDDNTHDKSENLIYSYPRSKFFKANINEKEYCLISKAADDEFNYVAKCCIELDRAFWASDQGFEVTIMKMDPIVSSPKHHVIYAKRTLS